MSGDSDNPTLSVVVALISGIKQDLEQCLRALHEQQDPPVTEILIPYDEVVSDVLYLQRVYPKIKFFLAEGLDTAVARSGASREHHDTLRTIGLKSARGRIVALIEDHARVSNTWCKDMVTLLDEHAHLAAIGGAVECGSERLLNRAVYYCDFGRYQNPLPEGPARYVSDNNVAYRREALQAVRDAWEGDYHETIVHDALMQRGYQLWLTPKSIVWQVRSQLSLGGAFRERFVWGRSYAGTRVRHWSAAKRLVYAVSSFVLPFLMTFRLLRGVLVRRRNIARFLASLPLIFVLQGVWALGELTGYLTADPGEA